MTRLAHRGFTLIEVLVALLVVAIAYTGVATAISGFVDQRLILVERTVSHRIAWNRLMEQYLVSRGIVVDQRRFAEGSGVERARGQTWRWQISEENAAGQGLVRYRVNVFPADESDSAPMGSLTAFFTSPPDALTQ